MIVFAYLESMESGGLKGIESKDADRRSTAHRVTSGMGVPACGEIEQTQHNENAGTK